MEEKTILDMTLRELQEAPDVAGITIKILVHKITPADSPPSSNPSTSQQPSKQEMRNALTCYKDKFGAPAARELIGVGTTLDQIMNNNPHELYQKIMKELDAPAQEVLAYD